LLKLAFPFSADGFAAHGIADHGGVFAPYLQLVEINYAATAMLDSEEIGPAAQILKWKRIGPDVTGLVQKIAGADAAGPL
jgi:hypothetical protein